VLGVDDLLVRIKDGGEWIVSKKGTLGGELQRPFSHEVSLGEGFSCEYIFPRKVELDLQEKDFL